MFFSISNKKYLTDKQLVADTMLKAYFIIEQYPLKTSERLLDQYIKQKYKVSLKNLCIKLLLDLTFHKNDLGNLILVFKNPEYDQLARLITYGNGVILGSKILQVALS